MKFDVIEIDFIQSSYNREETQMRILIPSRIDISFNLSGILIFPDTVPEWNSEDR